MITLALMLADEENRKLFSEIAQELEKPLKDFTAKLSKDMADATKSIADTTKAGLKLYTDDIDGFIGSIVGFCDVLEGKGSRAINNFSNSTTLAAREGVEKLANKLLDLEDKLKSVAKDAPTNTIKALTGEVEGVANSAKKAFVNLFSIDTVFKQVGNAISYASKIGDLADSLDVNTESFSNWADVIITSGGDVDSFASSLGQLKNHLDKAGSSKDVFSYLLELSEQMQNMSSSEANALGKSLNIDPKTVMLLKQGATSLQTMLEEQKKLGGVTKEDQATIEAFNNAMNILNHIIRTVALQIGTAILPALTWFLNSIQGVIDYLSEHKEFVKGFFIGISAVLLSILLPALWSAFAPLLPIIAVIVLLGTVCGLVFSFFSKKMNETGGVFEWLRNVVSVAIEGIVGLFSWLVDAVSSSISTIIEFFTFWLDAVSTIIDTIFVLFTQGPIEAIKFFQNAILDGLNKLYDKLPNWVKKLFSGIKGFFSSDESTTDIQSIEKANQIDEALAKGTNSLNGAQQTSQLLAATGSKTAISSNNQVSYKNNFNITSNNPEEVGRVVEEKMRSMSKEAEESFDDGVLA